MSTAVYIAAALAVAAASAVALVVRKVRRSRTLWQDDGLLRYRLWLATKG